MKAVALTAFLGLAGLAPAAHGQTAPTPTIPIAECTLTGPGIAICGGILVAGNELVKLMQGKQAFGQNGEIYQGDEYRLARCHEGPRVGPCLRPGGFGSSYT